jgi:phosphate transport system substrate-binding protein
MRMRMNSVRWSALIAGAIGLGAFGCASNSGQGASGSSPVSAVSGEITIDGSSTVYPVSEIVAEEFKNQNPEIKVTVGTSGTGGGFKKFSNGELDIAGASRAIEESEIEACKAKGIEFVEIPIAFDGLSIVVNPQNDFVADISVEDLKKIWMDGSNVKTWRDVNPAWPAEPIKLYGAGTDSGTFDYFTKAINGKEKSSRADYQASEDDNVLVQGVVGDKYSLGYFGYAYYLESKDKLKLLKVDGVEPTPDSIADGTYSPLSRPLFWYVNKKSLEKPQVAAIVKFLLSDSKSLVTETGYIPLPDEAYVAAQKRVDGRVTGTVFQGAQPGMKIQDILAATGK